MPLELQPATIEDIPRVVEIEYLAYKDDPVSPLVFPGPFPADAKGGRAEQIAEKLKDPTTQWTKVIDTETGEMAAFSGWNVHKPGEPIAEKQKRRFGPGCNIPACEDFFGSMYAVTEKHLKDGRPHVYLDVLLTDPKHQRKGAGRMLMDWGLKIADDLKLPAYLEASPYGHKLYLNCGFKDVESAVFDLSKYGGEGTNTIWFMERPAAA